MTPSVPRTCLRILLPLLAAVSLAACETTGMGAAEVAAKPEPPMNHSRAATECWMSTEKGSASTTLDRRADVVTKCIDQKMKGSPKS